MLRNISCYTPKPVGKKDILIAGDKIFKITMPGVLEDNIHLAHTIDAEGLYAFPGLIDMHAHITGGGGEAGFDSRAGEMMAEDIIAAGITTLVGLLGADGVTRSMEALYAKAKALEAAGLTTYIYSGSYALPPVTLTGSLIKDMVFIDTVIGGGEIAVSDHRSSCPSTEDLIKIAAQLHLGGLLAGKAGVMHLHVGDGKKGLGAVTDILKNSDLPMTMFIPTHVNRNRKLFREAVGYVKSGGLIDMTAGERDGIPVAEAVRILLAEDADLSRVTVSSDAGGSIPTGGVTEVGAFYRDFKEIIQQAILMPGEAVRLFSTNAAAVLKLYPRKGNLREGGDADILITDGVQRLRMLFGKGKLLFSRP
ncbi:beta-aspartyl-peptidase [Oscillospiraceae bacterium WX1]